MVEKKASKIKLKKLKNKQHLFNIYFTRSRNFLVFQSIKKLKKVEVVPYYLCD